MCLLGANEGSLPMRLLGANEGSTDSWRAFRVACRCVRLLVGPSDVPGGMRLHRGGDYPPPRDPVQSSLDERKRGQARPARATYHRCTSDSWPPLGPARVTSAVVVSGLLCLLFTRM
jgi:hypothetical protein